MAQDDDIASGQPPHVSQQSHPPAGPAGAVRPGARRGGGHVQAWVQARPPPGPMDGESRLRLRCWLNGLRGDDEGFETWRGPDSRARSSGYPPAHEGRTSPPVARLYRGPHRLHRGSPRRGRCGRRRRATWGGAVVTARCAGSRCALTRGRSPPRWSACRRIARRPHNRIADAAPAGERELLGSGLPIARAAGRSRVNRSRNWSGRSSCGNGSKPGSSVPSTMMLLEERADRGESRTTRPRLSIAGTWMIGRIGVQRDSSGRRAHVRPAKPEASWSYRIPSRSGGFHEVRPRRQSNSVDSPTVDDEVTTAPRAALRGCRRALAASAAGPMSDLFRRSLCEHGNIADPPLGRRLEDPPLRRRSRRACPYRANLARVRSLKRMLTLWCTQPFLLAADRLDWTEGAAGLSATKTMSRIPSSGRPSTTGRSELPEEDPTSDEAGQAVCLAHAHRRRAACVMPSPISPTKRP